MRSRSEVKAALCFVNESRYFPDAADVETSAEVDAEAEASTPLTEVLAAFACFVGDFFVGVPLERVEVDAFDEATFAAAIV